MQGKLRLNLLIVFWFLLFCTQIFTVKANNTQLESTLFTQAHNAMKPNKYIGIDSMLVYQKNQLISENYYRGFTKNTTHRTHSTFKSINALITLIAIDQGLIITEEFVMPLLSKYHNLQDVDPRKNRIKVKHLLNMTSGIFCDEAPGSDGPFHEDQVDIGPTPLKHSMAIKMSAEPGSQWHYCNANSFMLSASVSAALQRAGKDNIFMFADKYLMQPLDIKNYRFTKSQDGKFLNGQGNAHFTPRDLAKIGLLVLNKGQWLDKQIISEQAINKIYDSSQAINWSFTDEVKGEIAAEIEDVNANKIESKIKYQANKLPPTTYSHQWYKTTFELKDNKIEALHTWGNGGQFIFIMPSLDAVAVFTGSNQGNFLLQKQPFDIMHNYVLPELLTSLSDTN